MKNAGAHAEMRRAWTRLVSAPDLDEHMHSVGQAEANARLLLTMLSRTRAATGGRVLIAGAGTGQFLDYVDSSQLSSYHFVLADINPKFLDAARDRCRKAGLSRFEFVADDIERTALAGPFDVVVMILLLEHIDWRLGLRNMISLRTKDLCIVIQQNPAGLVSALSPQRKLNASMRAFAEVAQPRLIDADELIDFLREMGYKIVDRQERTVADNKTMLGMIFSNDSP